MITKNNFRHFINYSIYLCFLLFNLGDEVLEWNGRVLQGKTYEEVYDIIAESRHEPQVELIVSRQLSDVGKQQTRRHTLSGLGPRCMLTKIKITTPCP